ncbi:MAG: M23 family metallopeptidase [Bacteroidales bacterium]
MAKQFIVVEMYKEKCIVLWIILLFPVVFIGQDNGFRPPLDLGMNLSGTFGELRSNHFHSGIDIRTNRSIGYPVYAIADGWVSRLRVGPTGFGRALYLTHPTGHTSVYAHLNRFNDDITRFVRQKQYANESFSVNFYLSRNQIPVKRGDIIGYSGNSGSSAAPHLHFEIRNAHNQHPTNVLKHGFEMKDNSCPLIQRLRFYPVGAGSAINQKPYEQSVYVFDRGTDIKLNTSRVRISGKIALGVQAIDQSYGSTKKNGPYRVSMYADSVKFWEFIADHFSFYETRYMNAMIDYGSYKRNGHKYYQSYLRPGNQLSMIAVKDNGLVEFAPGQKRTIRIEVADLAGNVSSVEFRLEGAALSDSTIAQPRLNGKLFHYDKDNYFEKEGIRLTIPAGALYDTLDFRYNKEEMPGDAYSKVHHVHNEFTPLHDYVAISIKVDRLLSNGDKSKLMLMRKDHKGRRRPAGGSWNNGWVSAKIRDFGKYYVVADTIKPEITPNNFYPGKTVNHGESIRFTVKDDLSGIKYYRGEINGKWVLFQYDPKKNRLYYELDERVEQGENNLLLTVSDKKGNIKVYRASFVTAGD